MKKFVLFIQGGGEGAYKIDGKLAASLQNVLGPEYDVRYPRMPGEEDPQYETWKPQLSKELAELDDPVILVGHSVGASVLLRYLYEEKIAKPVAGIFLIATPFWGAEDWLSDEFTLHKNFAAQFPAGPPIFFYHNPDDEVVPFAHLAMFAKKLPHATFRQFDRGGHQFRDDLSAVAADIANL